MGRKRPRAEGGMAGFQPYAKDGRREPYAKDGRQAGPGVSRARVMAGVSRARVMTGLGCRVLGLSYGRSRYLVPPLSSLLHLVLASFASSLSTPARRRADDHGAARVKPAQQRIRAHRHGAGQRQGPEARAQNIARARTCAGGGGRVRGRCPSYANSHKEGCPQSGIQISKI